MLISLPVNDISEMSPDKYTIENAFHVCVSEDIAQSLIFDLKNKYSIDYTYYIIPMHILLEDIIAKKAAAVVIYGITKNEPIIIAERELLQQSDTIRIFNIMYSTVTGNYYSCEESYNLLKDSIFYFIGTIPQPDENGVIKKGTCFYLDDIERTENGTAYKSIRCFVNEYSAKKYGGEGKNIIACPLNKIKSFYGGKVIIEPHRNWWMEF